jgi:YVTN family beta-propeller protein
MAMSVIRPGLRVFAGLVLLSASAAAQGVPRLDSYSGVAVRILQSNNAGNIHHIIDPSINQVVGLIRGCPHAHNLTVHPDGLYYYCANEQQRTVDVFDTRTLRLVEQIALSERPNKIVVNKKHRKIYAGIVNRSAKVVGPGFQPNADGSAASVVDVIDIATHKVIKSIKVHHTVHNTYVTPDDNYVVAGLRGEVDPGEPTIEVIDPRTDTVVWGMELTGHKQYGRTHHEVRPMAFEANPDGSTKRMFAQITNLHGFAIVDWAQRKEVGRINLPDIPEAERNKDGIQGSPAHGLLIAPDGKTLWSTSKFNSRVYAYSMPDLKYLGEVKVGTVPDWLTFTPDSKKLYVANAHDNTVSVIDVAARKELSRIKVGQVPKRNITAILPALPSTN